MRIFAEDSFVAAHDKEHLKNADPDWLLDGSGVSNFGTVGKRQV